MNLSLWELISDPGNSWEITRITGLNIETVEVGLQQWARRGSGYRGPVYREPFPIEELYPEFADLDLELPGQSKFPDYEIKLVLKALQSRLRGENV